jgi:hypothetical protein
MPERCLWECWVYPSFSLQNYEEEDCLSHLDTQEADSLSSEQQAKLADADFFAFVTSRTTRAK